MSVLLGPLLDDVVTLALREDLAGGDLTTEAIVPADDRAIARAIARGPLVLAGGDVFARAFYLLDPSIRVEQLRPDGTTVVAGDELLVVEGATRTLLAGERVALNFLQRLSGIATLTRRFADAIPEGTGLRVADTRKTTPGLRRLERYAVRVGGGHNHRDSLGSAVLIKDNHIVAAGGIAAALGRARAFAPHTSRLSIEVESLAELDEALANGADIVLLDNFDDEAIPEAVRRARGKALVEVSGNVGLARVARLANAGVDVISIGALTHSAPAADIALDLERFERTLA